MKFKNEPPQNGVELPAIMTVANVAAVLRISRNTAYEVIHSKGFPTIRIGKQYRIPRDKFFLWLDSVEEVQIA